MNKFLDRVKRFFGLAKYIGSDRYGNKYYEKIENGKKSKINFLLVIITFNR